VDDASSAELQANERAVLAAELEDTTKLTLVEAQAAEEEARRKREDAELAHQRASQDQATAMRGVASAALILTVVKEALDSANKKLRDTEAEEKDAEKVLEAMTSQARPPPECSPPNSQRSAQGAKPRNNTSSTSSKPSTSPAAPELDDEEKHRQAAIAESVRKMQDLRRQEEFDAIRRSMDELNAREQRKEAAEAARADRARHEREQEEQQSREREEAERKEREEVARREKEQLEELRKEQAWSEATKRELLRCSTRDLERWPPNKHWTIQNALDRFQLLSDEFDALRFSNDVPLTVASIPWPVLCIPYDLVVKIHIEWKAVESFFRIVKTMLTPSQFGALLEKSQRRFHPDRWRSRGLLATVMDDRLKDVLESAVNIVSQATNELLSNWRSEKLG
jgi:hypothetical protein